MSEVAIVEFEPEHAAGVSRLATAVQWPSLTDPETVLEVCSAPGTAAYVALLAPSGGGPAQADDDQVVGWVQGMGDRVLQAHLGFLAVHPDQRRRGIARLLVAALFQALGGTRMDLAAGEDSEAFYRSFQHQEMPGFRIYPGV